MRIFHDLTDADGAVGEELANALAEIMMGLDDDLAITVKPMRRDSHWNGMRIFVRHEGVRWEPDPLWCHLLYLDSQIAGWVEEHEKICDGEIHNKDEVDWAKQANTIAVYLGRARDNLIANLDAAWS